ncbi:MAG: hypothetical protein HYX96_00720 [Chloroflexi bacterium]|nr:hypothetical protein [Chloroflexota bacterium]
MKKLRYLLAIVLALGLVAGLGLPALAGELYTHVALSDITVVENEAGTTVSGSVTVTSTSTASGTNVQTYAESNAWYSITSGETVIVRNDNPLSVFNGTPDGTSSSDASQTYTWSNLLDGDSGDYVVAQGGSAYAAYSDESSLDESAAEDANNVTVSYVAPPPAPAAPTVELIGIEAPSWYPTPDRFSLWGGGVYSYNWLEHRSVSVAPAIDLTTRTYWNNESWLIRIVVEEGTLIDGGYALMVNMTPDGVRLRTMNGPMTFSQPVTVLVQEDGDWKEVATFTSTEQ